MDNFFMYKKAVRAMDEINRVMEGKGHTVHQIMTAILAGGHILIEDIPGVGKTTLALAFSKVLGLDYQRIQFTPDIMPTDIAGFSIYHQGSEEFEFKEGAAMTNLLLADETSRSNGRRTDHGRWYYERSSRSVYRYCNAESFWFYWNTLASRITVRPIYDPDISWISGYGE